MTKRPASKRRSAKKAPTRAKRGTAPARKANKKAKSGKAKSGAPRGATAAQRGPSRVRGGGKKATKGKARTASMRSHKGASKPPKRSPAASPDRAGRAQAAKQAAESGGEGGATEAPGAHGQARVEAEDASEARRDRGRVEVRNVNVPGYRTTVDARRYHAMKDTLLAALPKGEPGLTQAEMFSAVRGKLPEDVFPGQEKTEWWVKCVHLDLEARGEMQRSATKPLRWWRT